MSLVVNTNGAALSAYNVVSTTSERLSGIVREMSTGLRIETAADDAAGLAISEKMRGQISGLDRAMANAQDGISLLQTAEGGLAQIHSILQRMRELSVQSANDTLTAEDRGYIQLEVDELRDQIDTISNTTAFNTKKLLDGSGGALWSSDRIETEATIHGSLTTKDQFGQKVSGAGNYKIDILATAGQAEVQKTNLFKIKHKDVVVDPVANKEEGIRSVTATGMPVAQYTLVSEKVRAAGAEATGTYGLTESELYGAVTARADNDNLKVNASILFEVTDISDEGTVTLSAIANTLADDGSEATKSATVKLAEGKWTDLSKTLGLGDEGSSDSEADGAFELKLGSGQSKVFSVGDKFVYNVTLGDSDPDVNRTITVTGVQNEDWPDSWDSAAGEIQVSNVFGMPEVVVERGEAQVLFLIDDSGTMATPIQTVIDNIENFIDTIQGYNVDLTVGVSGYRNAILHKQTFSTGEWADGSDIDGIKAALQAVKNETSRGASVNCYDAVWRAIDSSTSEHYTWNANGENSYIVLISDTTNEISSGTNATTATTALTNSGISFSAVSNSASVYQALIDASSGGHNYSLTSTTWGTELCDELGDEIGNAAAKEAADTTTPLADLDEVGSVFAKGGAVTLTLGENTADVTIASADTIGDLVDKLNTAMKTLTGESGLVSFDGDQNRAGTIVIRSATGSTDHVTFSGDSALVTALGFLRDSQEDDSFASNVALRFSLSSSKVMDSTINFRNFYLNSRTGEVYEGNISIRTDDEVEIGLDKTLAVFETTYIGEIAPGGTTLRDLEQFWDSQGNCLLDAPQTITITQGDGQRTSITLYGNDTLNDMTAKLNRAIGTDLGQGRYVDADGQDKFATFVDDADVSSEAVKGTMLIRSAVAGKTGELSFAASEEILNALGLNTIQESRESEFSVNVTDAHTGESIVSGARVTGNQLIGVVHKNVDVTFDPMAGIKATWNEGSKTFSLAGDGTYTTYLHLADNSMAFQIGANEGDQLFVDLGDMSSAALGLADVNVSSRERAGRSITLIDEAIDKVSTQRSQIGAYQNRLEYTMTNLTTASENLTAAESRIRDADMARGMMEFTKVQIMLQAGVSLLAQANQLPQNVLNLLR